MNSKTSLKGTRAEIIEPQKAAVPQDKDSKSNGKNRRSDSVKDVKATIPARGTQKLSTVRWFPLTTNDEFR